MEAAAEVLVAVLALAVAAMVRGLWAIQGRVARLEALDEFRERTLDLDRERELENPLANEREPLED